MDPATRVEKRNIPPVLQKILALDVEWTKKLVSFSLNFVPIRSLKTHCKFLEVNIKSFTCLIRLILFVLTKYFLNFFLFGFSTLAMDWFG